MNLDVFITRAKRVFDYLASFVFGATLPRLLNLVQNEIEYHGRKERLKSFPPSVTVDLINRCNLKCPLCLTGIGKLGRPTGKMSLADFERIIKDIKDRSFQVFLYCWGEPLLVKNLPDYVRVAKSAGLAVTFSSNFSLPISDDFIESLILAGTDRIIVSLDGVNSKTYSTYRVRGDFDLVLENVRRFAHLKKKLERDKPALIWQFLAFNFNEDQIPFAKKLYKQWGFDAFEIEKPNLPFGINDSETANKWFAKNKSYRLENSFDIKDNTGRYCFWPWRSAVIQSDGGLSPCCYVSSMDYDAGNVITQGFSAAWNSKKMIDARRTILGKTKSDPCSSCSAVVKK